MLRVKMFHTFLPHGNALLEQYSAGCHKAKSPLFRVGLASLGALMPFAELRAFRPDNAKLLASLIPVFAVLPRMGMPCSSNISPAAIKQKAHSLDWGLACFGSLDIPRGARDCSVGRTQHWLRS